VSIEADEETVRLVVTDNGVGFEAAALNGDTKRQGWGLLTMSERAEAVGGSFNIKTAPGQGTRVTVEVRR
jgi:signal transduction histidine kinase